MTVQELTDLTLAVMREHARRDLHFMAQIGSEIPIPSDEYLNGCIQRSAIFAEWLAVALAGAHLAQGDAVTAGLASIRQHLFAGQMPPEAWLQTPFGALYASAALQLGLTGQLAHSAISVGEAAKRLGVTPSAISQRLQRGSLRAVDVPRRNGRARRMVLLADVLREEAQSDRT